MTLLCAGLLGCSTGTGTYQPIVDVIARAKVNLKAGDVLGNDHSPALQTLIRPARPVQTGTPLPLHMGNGNPLVVAVPAGSIITNDMVAQPADSVLWALRAQQDKHFLRNEKMT